LYYSNVEKDNVIRNIIVIIFIGLCFFVLKQLSAILLPLALAILAVLVSQPLVFYLLKHKIPKGLVIPLIVLSTLFIIVAVVSLIVGTARDMLAESDAIFAMLTDKIITFLDSFQITERTGIDIDFISDLITSSLNTSNLSKLASSVALFLSSFGSSFFMFALYFTLLLAGSTGYAKFMKYVGGEFMLEQYETIRKSISSYITIKFFISLITGILAGIIISLFGVRFALFWAFITFLLNFIPQIGSLFSSVLPVLMAFIQYDSPLKPVFLLILLTTVQMIIGNLIEPKIMGNRLRLNVVTVLFGLVFWGYIWGIPGMILAVPLLVILKLVISRFESLGLISRIMGIAPNESSDV